MTLVSTRSEALRRSTPEDEFAPELRHYGDTINRFALEKVERRTAIVLFGRSFAFERSVMHRRIETLRLTPTAASILPCQGRRQSWPVGLWASAAAVTLTVIGAALFATAGPPTRGYQPVVAPLPPPAVSRTTRPGAQRLRRAAGASPDAGSRAAPPPVAMPVYAPPHPDAPRPLAASTAVELPAERSLTLAQARTAALSSGEPTRWAEGTASGMVVVGREERRGEDFCREIAVFTRTDGDAGSANSTRRCRPGSAPK